MISVLKERLETRQTGSQWQLDKLASLRKELHKRDALSAMLREYQQNSAANIPVAQWK